ncbi:MAG: hypothetical protein V1790_05875 [Planctomycetota bacterium]
MSALRSDMPPTRSVGRPWIDQLITTQHRRMSLGDQSRRAGTRVALLRGPDSHTDVSHRRAEQPGAELIGDFDRPPSPSASRNVAVIGTLVFSHGFAAPFRRFGVSAFSDGIVYCPTRAETERVAAMLSATSLSGRPCHASLSAPALRSVHEWFLAPRDPSTLQPCNPSTLEPPEYATAVPGPSDPPCLRASA